MTTVFGMFKRDIPSSWSPWCSSNSPFCFCRAVPAEGYCSMYGICAQRSDGKVLNCANATKAVKVTIWSSHLGSMEKHCPYLLQERKRLFKCGLITTCFISFPARHIVFVKDPKFVPNNYWRCLLYCRPV